MKHATCVAQSGATGTGTIGPKLILSHDILGQLARADVKQTPSAGDALVFQATDPSERFYNAIVPAIDATVKKASDLAIHLFADRFIESRLETSRDDSAGAEYTVWVYVKEPKTVPEEVAMENDFYVRWAENVSSGIHRPVTAILGFR
jgi:hypothetical protein